MKAAFERSAQTYPACRRSGRRQDGEPHVPSLISMTVSQDRFFCQAAGTPLDRQAIFAVLPQTYGPGPGACASARADSFYFTLQLAPADVRNSFPFVASPMRSAPA